ncbi:MAG: hypothetical protein IJK92_09260 [Bacteroidales bacterium]|nr:hypothetical protein [Bacteroidales bacterium]
MKFINNAKWDLADEYLIHYQDLIDTVYPELKNKTIEICNENEYGFSCHLSYDKKTPFQIWIKEKDEYKSIVANNDIIFIVNSFVGGEPKGVFEKHEIFALLSHEIGHLSVYYRGKDSIGLQNEILADNCARTLRLTMPLIAALKKINLCLADSLNQPWTPFKQDSDHTIDDIDERIKRLQWLTIRPIILLVLGIVIGVVFIVFLC